MDKTTRGGYGSWLWLAFSVCAGLYIVFNPNRQLAGSFAIVFSSIALEAMPFMLLGSIAGGLIESFLDRKRMIALLPGKEALAVWIAAGMGMIFPVCECAIVPIIRRLTGKGLPAAAAIAYLLGGPIVNPVVFASTCLAYRMSWRVALMRLLWGYVIATGVAMLMGRLFGRDEMLVSGASDDGRRCGHGRHRPGRGGHDHAPEGCACGRDHGHGEEAEREQAVAGKLAAAFGHALDDFMVSAPFLVAGAFIAALAQTHFDRADFAAMAANTIAASPVMMILAILLNLCSEADAFIAASFSGFVPFAAQMAFMLIGPMFDLKLLLMYRGVFRKKAICALIMLITVSVLAVSLLIGFLGSVR
ncbi:MAG: permease [Planctomycetota bacterium]|jgi:uncharacterized membrane protein YraQ (UPF0718 family)|nr:permease [Planctomycetota bacterium]